MKKVEEKQIMQKFQIEKLEKRYEMGRWIGSVKVGAKYENIKVQTTFDLD